MPHYTPFNPYSNRRLMIVNKDWVVKSEGEECVHVHINTDVDIKDLEFKLIDSERKTICSMKVTSYEIYLCSNVGYPMFAQLGDNLKYVDGSGVVFYKKN